MLGLHPLCGLRISHVQFFLLPICVFRCVKLVSAGVGTTALRSNGICMFITTANPVFLTPQLFRVPPWFSLS